MNLETQTPTLVEQFASISVRPERKGSVLVFRLWNSSYYPAGLASHNRNTPEEAYWHQMVRDRHLSLTNVLSGAKFEGSLFVYELQTPQGAIYLAQMDLRGLSTQLNLREFNGEETPQIDLSLVSRRALMPNFQQVRGMSGGNSHYAHIYTVDEEGSDWSHHVEQDWKNNPLTKDS